MHPRVLSETGWKIVRALVGEGLTEAWALAGGTGLALHLGHRVSHDLEFFRFATFDPTSLAAGLSAVGRVQVQSRSAGTLHVKINQMRVSFLAAQRPLLFGGTPYRGLTIADPRDIAVMKVLAIGGRGSRRDFVDLFFYLRDGGSLDSVLAMVHQRFKGIDYNDYHLLRSLVYFDDAESEPMPRMIRRATWREIKRAIVAEVRRLS